VVPISIAHSDVIDLTILEERIGRHARSQNSLGDDARRRSGWTADDPIGK
jgi:hypothetical protein